MILKLESSNLVGCLYIKKGLYYPFSYKISVFFFFFRQVHVLFVVSDIMKWSIYQTITSNISHPFVGEFIFQLSADIKNPCNVSVKKEYKKQNHDERGIWVVLTFLYLNDYDLWWKGKHKIERIYIHKFIQHNLDTIYLRV